MSARMGIFQETLYKRFGKHSKEALFYNVSHGVSSVALTGQTELLRALFPPILLSDPSGQLCELLQTLVSALCSLQTPSWAVGGCFWSRPSPLLPRGKEFGAVGAWDTLKTGRNPGAEIQILL